jgi:hypothetical protein
MLTIRKLHNIFSPAGKVFFSILGNAEKQFAGNEKNL